jgi:hypothetical protein
MRNGFTTSSDRVTSSGDVSATDVSATSVGSFTDLVILCGVHRFDSLCARPPTRSHDALLSPR